MRVHEFVDEGLGHSSYVIDLGDGTAAVVDPPRFPIEHEALIDRSGWNLRWVIDTHSHADYVTGSPGLAARRGATFIAPAASNLETPHHAIGDGERVALVPGVTLMPIATPGHTPDHHTYALEVDGVPVALFTGGLVDGRHGRADRSVRPRTDGAARARDVPLVAPLRRAPRQVERVPHARCRVVVDARPIVPFGAGHVPGSISNALRPVFGSWLGWLVPAGIPLVFVLDPDQDRQDLVRQCLDVGHEHLVGELDGGVGAWAPSGRPVTTIPVAGVDSLGGTVIDVRQASEYAAGHLPGGRNIELGSIPIAPLVAGEAVAVMCGHGERAMSAASILATKGVAVQVFDGGPDTWAAATGNALESGR